MPRLLTLLRPAVAAAATAALLAPAAASAAEYVPGEVVVRTEGDPARVVKAADVPATLERLRRDGDVVYAARNPVARASAFFPNDPGVGSPGDWQQIQWNFLAEEGVDAPTAWQHAIDAGAPGGRGVRIAVLDSGVAYADRGRFRRSPDLRATRFAAGYDFVDNDARPYDENGHGTHVTSTIAESTNN